MSVDGYEEMLEQVWEEAYEQLPNGTEKEILELVTKLIKERGEHGDYLYSTQKGGD